MNMRVLLLAAGTLAACACVASELAPFVLPWDDASAGPTDLSGTLEAPAGRDGPVCVRDGHLAIGNRRLRLFGVNVTAAACFPDHETAAKVAARMAKFGINVVRFHFLDSTWGDMGLIDYKSGDSRRLRPEAFDRLDYFIAELRERGIYADLNLLVGRRFGGGDGIDPAINRLDWKAAQAVGFFYAPHQALQEDYARQLLTHRNPYTKLTYAEDPAVAFVEINNENGLMHTWLSGKFDALPEPFTGDLARQWNQWLTKRYADTAELAKAWGARAPPLGPEMLTNAGFGDGAAGWQVEQHGGARVAIDKNTEGLVLRVEQTGSAGWHVQLNQAKLAVEKNGIYTARFRAAADKERRISVTVMQAHEPWRQLGLQTTVTLGPQWQDFTFTFIGGDDDAEARFGFSDMNQEGATFRFADASLRPGGRVGLGAEESLQAGKVRVPKAADSRAQPLPARRDWFEFLRDTEGRHWDSMRQFIRDELGCRALVVGTIVATSTPNLMSRMDVVDTHAYWQHPVFPGRSWDQNNWYVRNRSMVDYPNETTLGTLARQRVAGKPHIVSEYNHPAPNPHAAEGPLLLAAYAGLQDWDALFMYTYAHTDAGIKAGRIPGFFDVGQHPAIMANVAAASLIFRRGDVSPGRRLVTASLPPAKELDLMARYGRAWQAVPTDRLGIDAKLFMRCRVALDLDENGTAAPLPPSVKDGDWTADTGQLQWRMDAGNKGLVIGRTPRAKILVGRAEGHPVELGDGITVEVSPTMQGWCTITLVSLSGEALSQQPRRALLVATGYCENTNMGWRDAGKTTVGTDWGRPPSVIEPIRAAMALPSGADLPTVRALDERGQPTATLSVARGPDGTAIFTIGPDHATLWYEIRFDAAEN